MQNINFTEYVNHNGEWFTVTIKGIKFRGEYDVTVLVTDDHRRPVVNKQIACKRVATINKLLAPLPVVFDI